MARKVLMEVILKVVRFNILKCRVKLTQSISYELGMLSEVRRIFRMLAFTKKTFSLSFEEIQNAKNDDEYNLCCNPKDGR